MFTLVLVDKNPKTAETFPAFSSSKIIRHLKYICQRKHRCVDTITVYLNGPTFLNGDILLWDRNRDGRATDMEVLTIDELLTPFGNCGARNVLLLADQNYAGNIVNRIRKLRNKSSQYNNVHVITASSKKSLSYERTFTEEFIKRDNVWIDDRSATAQARQIKHIFKVTFYVCLFRIVHILLSLMRMQHVGNISWNYVPKIIAVIILTHFSPVLHFI